MPTAEFENKWSIGSKVRLKGTLFYLAQDAVVTGYHESYHNVIYVRLSSGEVVGQWAHNLDLLTPPLQPLWLEKA